MPLAFSSSQSADLNSLELSSSSSLTRVSWRMRENDPYFYKKLDCIQQENMNRELMQQSENTAFEILLSEDFLLKWLLKKNCSLL